MTFHREYDLRIAYEKYAANIEHRFPAEYAKTEQTTSRGRVCMPGCDAHGCAGHPKAMPQLKAQCGRRRPGKICENIALLPEKARGTEWWCCADCMVESNVDAKLQRLLDRDETSQLTPGEAWEAMHNATALVVARAQRGRA